VTRPLLQTDEPSFRLPRIALAGGFLAFFVSGGAVSLYGPAAPAFRRVFGVETFISGLPASVHPFVALAGVLLWAGLSRRLRPGRFMAVAVGTLGLGALGVALAPSMAAVLSWVVLIGFGFGVLSNSMNSIYPRDTGPRTAVTVGRMHGAFGVGAVVTPLILAWGGYTTAYLVIAVLAVAAMPLLARTPALPELPAPTGEAAGAVRRSVWWFAALFGCYVATESATGAWLATHLQGVGWSEPAAARWTSAFWLVFTVGRFAVAPLALRIPPGRLVRIAMPGAAVMLLLASVPALAPYALVAAGVFAAPVFPSAMVWLIRSAPSARNGTTAAMIAGTIGATVGPAAVGATHTVVGGSSIPVTLALLAMSAGVVAVRISSRSGTG
jgi:MFS transporter, FHS family, glucose/mannose:H+ symporter